MKDAESASAYSQDEAATQVLPAVDAATDAAGVDAITDTEQVEGEENKQKATLFSTKRRRVVGGVAAAVCACALVGGGIAWATSQPRADAPVAAPPEQSAPAAQAADKADAKSEIKLTLTAEGAQGAPAKAEVLVADAAGKTVIDEHEIEAGEEVTLGELAKGDYRLYVTRAPVLADGSTYKLPDAPIEFAVDGKGSAISESIALEKIAASDMSKEQLEAAAGALTASGADDAAATASAQAAKAPSRPGSAPVKPTPAPQAPQGGGSAPAAPSTPDAPAKPSAPTPPPAPAPAPKWVVDKAAWDEYVVDVPAQAAVPEQGHWVPYWLSGGIRFNSLEEAVAYSNANKVSTSVQKEWIVDVPAQPTIPEQGHTVHHAEEGHWE